MQEVPIKYPSFPQKRRAGYVIFICSLFAGCKTKFGRTSAEMELGHF